MTRAQFNGRYAVLVGCMIFVILGVMVERAYSVVADFNTLYFPTKCLLLHHDPYRQSEVLKVYQDTRGNLPPDSEDNLQIATRDVYPPPRICFWPPLRPCLRAWRVCCGSRFQPFASWAR